MKKMLKSTLISLMLLGGTAVAITPLIVSCNNNSPIEISSDTLTKELLQPITLKQNNNGDYEGAVITNGKFNYDCSITINNHSLVENTDYVLEVETGKLIIKKSAINKYGKNNVSISIRQKPSVSTLISKINVVQKNPSKIYVGDDAQFVAEIFPNNATNKTVDWEVSDTTKATITKNGLLSAKAEGNILVRAKAKDGSEIVGQTSINIVTGELKTMTFSSGSRHTIDIDSTALNQYHVYANGSETPLDGVKWKVLNGAAEIDPNTGILKPLGDGGSDTIVASKEGYRDATFEIEVASFNKVKFVDEMGMNKGQYVMANTEVTSASRQSLTGTLVIPSRYWNDENRNWTPVTNFYEEKNIRTVKNIIGAFEYCKQLEKIVIPDSIKEISYRSFSAVYVESYDQPLLKEIVIRPDSICEKIDANAFFMHTAIEKVTINKNMTTIEDGAFGSSQIKTIIMDSPTIANSTTTLGGFYGISNQTVYVKDDIELTAESFIAKDNNYTLQQQTEMTGYKTYKSNAN